MAGGGGRPGRRHGRLRRQRGSRAREILADPRVLPEPRCHLAATRRTHARSSHQTPVASTAPDPALACRHTPSPITKFAQEPISFAAIVEEVNAPPALGHLTRKHTMKLTIFAATGGIGRQ